MRPVILVHGTWGRDHAWYRPGGALFEALKSRGFDVYSFAWSGFLCGLPTTHPGDPTYAHLGADEGRLVGWLDAGEKLKLFCENLENCLDPFGGLRPHVVSHSHGLQVVAFAAALGQRFGTAISISGPIRRDMKRALRAGLGNIERWAQVVDPDDDMTIREGQFGDGEVGWNYDLELQGAINIHTPGSGHSGMTEDIEAWGRHGLFSLLNA